MRLVLALLVAVLLPTMVVTACSTSKDAVAVGDEFEFVAPGGRTEILYDPPERRGSVGALAGESLLEAGTTIGLGDGAGGAQGRGPAGAGGRGVEGRAPRAAAADFVRDRALTYASIYDPPGRTLAGLGGVPRNVGPLTVVLDRRHRVAAVYLRSVRVTELIPLVARRTAEAPAP